MSALPVASNDQTWRDLNFDVAWEATPSGTIRCCTVLNKRNDIFRAVEGINLSSVHSVRQNLDILELLQRNGRLRHVEVRLPALFGSERLYITASYFEDRAVGTFCAMPPAQDEVFKSQLALLDNVASTQAREEAYREEVEIMLEGLRTLLSDRPGTQKFDELTLLAVRAIRGDSHVLFEIAGDGKLHPLRGEAFCTADCEALGKLSAAQNEVAVVYGDKTAQINVLRRILGVRDGQVALMLFAVAGTRLALLCAAHSQSSFQPPDVGLASRFALIVQQALLMKDEQEKLIQAGRLSALGQMSATLAHELRQPLNTISLAAQNLEMLAERGELRSENVAGKATRIREQVEKASQIMDRVRKFSRKKTEPLSLVAVDRLFDGVRMLAQPDLMAAGIKFYAEAPEGLFAHCDAIQVEQVLLNLIRNSRDAIVGIGSSVSKECGSIVLRARALENGVAFRIEDDGPGFPKELISRQVETFYTTKSADAGTGLGLSVCHTIAREHAGSFEIGNHKNGAFAELRLPSRTDAVARQP